jgi:hypothetical protein
MTWFGFQIAGWLRLVESVRYQQKRDPPNISAEVLWLR